MPEALLELKEDMMFCSFSYRCKVIIEGVTNIIEIGYNINIGTVDTLEAINCRAMKNLIPFHVSLYYSNLFQNIYHNQPVYFSFYKSVVCLCEIPL